MEREAPYQVWELMECTNDACDHLVRTVAFESADECYRARDTRPAWRMSRCQRVPTYVRAEQFIKDELNRVRSRALAKLNAEERRALGLEGQ